MADIRKMLDELDIYAPDFSGTFITEQGNQYECFSLPKRECLILVSGYNVKIRTKIIDRWQQLEQATAPRLPLGTDRCPYQAGIRFVGGLAVCVDTTKFGYIYF